MKAKPIEPPMKLSRIVPSRRQTVKFTWCKKNWMPFGTYREARESFGMSVQKTCFWCRYKFTDSDPVAVACVERKKNTLLCETCADELLESQQLKQEREKEHA